MRIWPLGLILLTFGGGIANAQFVAFNDHAPGGGTSPNATTWNVNGDTPGRTGPLKNIATGADLPVTLTITVTGAVTGEGSQSQPAPGTPVYNTFNTFVDFEGTPNPSVALTGGTVTYSISGLDPNKRYSFKGSAVRGGAADYTNRWTLFELVGANSFTSAHTAHALTTAQVGTIAANQVAINTGLNNSADTGDMADWENIDPGPDGIISINSSWYQGNVPGGSSSGSKGYGLTGMRLEEFNTTPVAATITNQPQSTTVGELQPASFTVGASGNPQPTYQWEKNTVPILDATNSTYNIPSTPLSDHNAVFRVVVKNVTNGVTNVVISANATLMVNADTIAPTLVRASSVGANQVLVTFSEPVTELSATNVANYAVTNTSGSLTISNAILQANGSNVVLTTSAQASGVNYTLRVNGIRDLSAAANQIAANSLYVFNTAAGYTGADVGGPTPGGSVNSVTGGADVSGAGADIGGAADQFTYAWQQRSGDFDIKVRVQGLSPADVWTKAAIMARQSLANNSMFAAAIATPSVSGCFFESRATVGAAAITAGATPANYPDTWLRLRRTGNTYTGFAGFDGATWVQLGTASIAMTDPIYFGFAVSSHTNTVLASAQFRDVDGVTIAAVVNSLPLAAEPLGPSSRRSGLVITEIMYHPKEYLDGGDLVERGQFIEIFNSQPFWENMSGYRLSGDVSYTFPSNTIIPAGGFIVIADDPAYVQSTYGISNVLGPIDNLPNDSGTVRLRSRAGAVLQEVNYRDENPWPIAPDGAGPSLVLVRPSLGERNPAAWAASDRVGGSPGAAEPLSPSGRTVVINEILAHTDNDEDFVELYNHGTQPVNLSGAILTDSSYLTDPSWTNKYIIPSTTLGANSYLYFTQSTLGFGLRADGDRIFLINSNATRVLDAVGFDAQSDGVSIGRLPDGSPTFRELAATTPGVANRTAGLKSFQTGTGRDIVINEIMYNPISGDDNYEYLELYNKGTNNVSLADWQFVDGIDFTFPSNAVINAGGYVVAAKNKANLLLRYPGVLNANNTFGPYDGTLANGGERVALARPEPDIATNGMGGYVTNIIYVVVNEVTYQTGGRWGNWSDGGGSSLELIDPHSDNQQPANWADSDETAKGQWTSFEFTSGIGETLNSPSGQNTNVDLFLLGIGECLMDDIEVRNNAGANIVPNPGFDGSIAPWTPQGSHDYSTIESAAGNNVLHLRAASRGDNGANRIRSMLTMAASGNVTLRGKARWLRGWPEVMIRLHGGGVEVTGKMPLPETLGTPGAPNSRLLTQNPLTANAGPAIYDVSHNPVMPAANENVTVTAKTSDPDSGVSLTLRYRIDPAANYSPVTMLDNGVAPDTIAGDGIYSATIPGQTSGGTVAWYIEATDAGIGGGPATNTFPQDVFPPRAAYAGNPGLTGSLPRCFPNDAVTRECVLRWGDTQMPGNLATYHLWLTSATASRWQTRDPLNNSTLDGTFVYNNYRAIYNSLPLYAGSPWHRGQMTTGPTGAQRCDYVQNFPQDDPLLGNTDFVLNNPGNPGGTSTSDNSAQTEQTSYIIFKEIGVVYNHRRYVHLFVNGNQRSTTTGRSGNFIFEDSQQPNSEMIEEWFRDNTDGDFYKIEDWFEFANNGYDFNVNNDADLSRRLIPGTTTLATAPYRFMFRRRAIGAGESASDYASLHQVVNAASPPANPTGPIDFPAFDALVNWDQWMRIFAVQRTVGNWDSYGWERGKNDYMYQPVGGKFEQMTWDIDFTMGVGGREATRDLFVGISDPRIPIMMNEFPIRRAYWRAFADIINGPLQNSFLDPILDAKQAALQANNVNVDPGVVANNIKPYIRDRRAFIVTQLATVAAPFAVTGSTTFTTTNNLLTISGTAPVDVKTILINGIEYPVRWTSVTGWTISIALESGLNALDIQGYNSFGNPINSAAMNITYNGPQIQPQGSLVINEIMYQPAISNAAYIEIYNNSPIAAFDLSNWRLDGVDYTFADGTIITNGQILLIVKDRTAFAAAYGAAIPVFDQFDGNLDPDGEKIKLIKRSHNPNIPEQLIDAVRYEAITPWPTAAAAGGTSLQLIDATQDNSRVSNWSDGSGWRFHRLTGIPNATASTFTLTMDSAGDFYIDDISLVAGSVPGVGQNLIQNGDFESGVLTPWAALGNHSGSTVSTAIKYSGNASLHVISTGVGNSTTATMSNLLAFPVNASGTYTLSFWYLSSTNANNLNYRLTSTFRTGNLTPAINLKPASSSPGSNNTTVAIIEPYPLLWINEIAPNNISGLTDNNNEHEPWIELFNSSSNAIPLDGYSLANNYTNLAQWTFPNGTTINPGEYKVLFADAEPNESSGNQLHTNFRLDGTNGAIVLSKAGRILDYINYSAILPNFSYGSFPDAQVVDRQRFFYNTPGGPNNGSPVPIIINEWLASNTGNIPDPANGRFEDWIELYNFGPVPIDLTDYWMTDNLSQKRGWQFPTGTVINASSFLLIWADNAATNSTPTDLHANFQLRAQGEEIGLYTPDLLRVDEVTFGPQANNVSQGRYVDGNVGGVLHFMTTPSPQAPNVIPANQAAPVLPTISNRTINERTTLTFTNLATDSDVPVQTLTYSLDAGAPLGASITTRGVFSWTPTEAQGGATYPITVRVSDNGSPTFTDSKTFNVTVNKVNVAPDVPPISSRTLQENTTLSFTVAASDSDLPAQTLSFSLLNAPGGATIDNTGTFNWTPAENQGPSTNNILVRVTDNGSPSLTTTQTLTVIVTEVNTAPVLQNPGTVTIDELKAYTNFLVASDSDLPANTLTFGLVAPFVNGVQLNTSLGRLTWTPNETNGPGSFTVNLRVFDNGSPSMSATQSFTIIVNEVNSSPTMTNLNNSTRTIDELTSITLTNRGVDIDFPTNLLTYEIVTAPPGATVNPTNGIFNWTPNETQGPSSNNILVRVYDNGTPSLSATQRFVIMVNDTISQLRITDIHRVSATELSITWDSVAGQTYEIEYRDDLDPQTSWHTLANSQVTATGSSQTAIVNIGVNPPGQQFYRVAKTN